MKSQINIRASALTQRQLAELTAHLGTSITETITLAISNLYQQETKTMTSNKPYPYANQEVPVHPKPDYSGDPITALAFDVYVAAYQPYGEANPDRVAVIEEWLRTGNLDDKPSVDALAAEWLALENE